MGTGSGSTGGTFLQPPASVQAIQSRPWYTDFGAADEFAHVVALGKGTRTYSGAEKGKFVPAIQIKDLGLASSARPMRVPSGYTRLLTRNFQKLGFTQGQATMTDKAYLEDPTNRALPYGVTTTSQGKSRIKREWHELGFTYPGKISASDARVLNALQFPEAGQEKPARYINIRKEWISCKEWNVLKKALQQAVEKASEGDVKACDLALSTAADIAMVLTKLPLRSSVVDFIKLEAQSRAGEIKKAYEKEITKMLANFRNMNGPSPQGAQRMTPAEYSAYKESLIPIREIMPSFGDGSTRWAHSSLQKKDFFPLPSELQIPSIPKLIFLDDQTVEGRRPSATSISSSSGRLPPLKELLLDLFLYSGGLMGTRTMMGFDPQSLKAARWSFDAPKPKKNPQAIGAVKLSSVTHDQVIRDSGEIAVVTNPKTGATVAVGSSTRDSTVISTTDDTFISVDGGVTVINRNRITKTLIQNLLAITVHLNRPKAKDPNDPTAEQPLSNLRADQITWSQLWATLVLLLTLMGEKTWEYLIGAGDYNQKD